MLIATIYVFSMLFIYISLIVALIIWTAMIIKKEKEETEDEDALVWISRNANSTVCRGGSHSLDCVTNLNKNS